MSNHSYKIIELSVTDIPRIAEFLGRHTKSFCDEEKWRITLNWMWIENPFVNPQTKFGWALENCSHSICGFIGNVPVAYACKEMILPAIWGTSWYVDEKVKDLALKLYINFTRQSDMIFSNTQSKQAEVVMQKLGFKELNVEWFRGRYIWPLNIFTTEFASNFFIEVSAKKIAIGVFGIVLKVLASIAIKITRNNSNEITLKKIETFPSNTDAWFSEFAKGQDCSFVRDRKSYEWLYCQQCSKNDFIKYEILSNGKTQGFIIFKKRSNNTITYAEIIDEALIPVSIKKRKAIILKVLLELYKDANDMNFAVIRSNMPNNLAFFTKLCAINIKKYEKGYLKVKGFMPDITNSTFSSIDGDNVFF